MTEYYPVILTILLSSSDAFWYGWVHEIKGWLKNSLFREWPFNGEKWVPFYRLLIQWPLDIAALWIVYDNCGIWVAVFMLLAWGFMNKEMNYYLILGQWSELQRYEREKVKVYWLDSRIYFSGYIFFIDGFTVKRFVWSYALSWLFLAVSILIQNLKL